MTSQTITLACACGRVELEIEGKPIVSVECLCTDCQTAGAFLQLLPGAPSTLVKNSATRFVLYRKDRVRCCRGQALLREHRLKEESKTRRVVATCCNAPIFLEFTNGHWLSIYGNLWSAETLPALELRTMACERPKDTELPDNVPNPDTHTFSFYTKLFRAWAAMRFRTPKVDYVNGDIN